MQKFDCLHWANKLVKLYCLILHIFCIRSNINKNWMKRAKNQLNLSSVDYEKCRKRGDSDFQCPLLQTTLLPINATFFTGVRTLLLQLTNELVTNTTKHNDTEAHTMLINRSEVCLCTSQTAVVRQSWKSEREWESAVIHKSLEGKKIVSSDWLGSLRGCIPFFKRLAYINDCPSHWTEATAAAIIGAIIAPSSAFPY